MSFLVKVIISISNFKSAFANDYQVYSPEIEKIKDEFYDLGIPGNREDKANLKSDRDQVSKDYFNAVEEKKLELEY